MVHFYESLPENLRTWALEQKVFFTASAPLNGKHVNLSPKGLLQATFHIFDPNHAAYLDTAGSGIETISHIYENKRVTLMFCSLDGQPRIMRLFCTGSVVERIDARFKDLMQSMGQEDFPGIRAIIMLDIWKVQTSCGYGVPILDRDSHSRHLEDTSENCSCYKDRPTLEKMLDKMVKKEKLDSYILDTNKRSLDGLLGLRDARQMNGEWLFADEIATWIGRQLHQGPAIAFGILVGLFLFAFGPKILLYVVNLACKLYARMVRT